MKGSQGTADEARDRLAGGHRLGELRREGATVTPAKQSWELLLGIKVTEPGYLVRDAVRIHCSAGGEDYTRTRPAQLAVCTSPTQVNGRCPFSEDVAR